MADAVPEWVPRCTTCWLPKVLNQGDVCTDCESHGGRRSGHWTGVEENQTIQMVAAMTGRTPEEVKEPLSRLLHQLRYSRGVYCEGCERHPTENETFSRWGAEVYTCPEFTPDFHPDPSGMVITDLDAWEGEDGG
jgi:hypothetical protein